MRPIRLSPGGRIYVVVFPLYFNVCMMFSKEEMFKTEACWIDNRCHYTTAVKSFHCICAVRVSSPYEFLFATVWVLFVLVTFESSTEVYNWICDMSTCQPKRQ